MFELELYFYCNGPIFLSNVLVRVRVVFLLDYLLILSLLKHRSIGAFLNPKKMRIPNMGNPLRLRVCK